ncbi:MAG TPA: HEAT repeat domain-containing protein, partial [bacterium]|nr:HEAT repeat domain-containing protein [bacterium]
ENSSFRYQSVILLQKLEVTQLANRFWEILDQGEEEGHIRSSVADALIQWRQIKGIDELRRLLQDRDVLIQFSAILAARDWEMREAIPDLWQLIKHGHGRVRFITALVLDRFGEFKTMEDLQTILHVEECADIASRVLARLGGIGEIEHFRKFLKHEKFYVRQQALIGFIKIPSDEIIEDLNRLLSDEYEFIRETASRELKKRKLKKDLEDLQRATEALREVMAKHRDGDGGAMGLLLGSGAGLATLLGASEAHAAVAAVSEIGQGGLSGLGVGLASFAVGGIFHWLAKRLQRLKGGEPTSTVDRQVQSLMSRLANCFSEEKIGLRAALVALGKEAVPALIAFLSHENGQARLEAVMALKAMEAREAADEIGKLLKDSDSFVRAQAAVTLAEWGQIKTVDEVRALLGDPSDLVKHMGIETVVKFGIREAIPELWRLAEAPKEVAGQLAIDALAKMGELETAESLRRLKVEPNTWSSHLFAEVLVKVGGVGELDLFRRFLQDKDPAVRQTVLWGLINIDSEEILGDLIPLLKDKNPNVRLLAERKMKILCGLPSPKADHKLNAVAAPAILGLDMLLNGHPTPLGLAFSAASLAMVGGIFHRLANWLRQKPAEASGAETDSESPPDEVAEEIQALAAQMLEQADWEEGIQRLVNYGPKAVPALLPFLQVGDRQIRWEVLRALAAFDARETVDSVRALLKDPDDYIQLWAAMLLEDWGEFKSVEDIRALLNHPNDSLKSLGVEVAAKGKVQEAFPELWEVALNLGTLSSMTAIGALERLGELKNFNQIRRLKVEPNTLRSPILVKALAQDGGIEELDLFRRFLTEKNSELREALVQALVKFESEEILPDLIALLRDPHPQIRSMATTRIRELSGVPSSKPDPNLNAVAAPALLGLDLLLQGQPSLVATIGVGIASALLLAGAGGPYRKKVEGAKSEPIPLRDLPLSPRDVDSILKFLDDFHRSPRTPPSAELRDAEAAGLAGLGPCGSLGSHSMARPDLPWSARLGRRGGG